jgi:LmbE family N-acetylglucosaminyl deacetylase
VRLLLSPHNDDAVLFASFTLLRECPLVVTCFDSHVQESRGAGITAEQRRAEDQAAMRILGASVEFLGLRDSDPQFITVPAMRALLAAYGQPEMVYAPMWEREGHSHHNLVSGVAAGVFDHVTYYTTYTTSGKSRGKPVEYALGWLAKKLRALACYESQIGLANCHEHFLRDQIEYYA